MEDKRELGETGQNKDIMLFMKILVWIFVHFISQSIKQEVDFSNETLITATQDKLILSNPHRIYFVLILLLSELACTFCESPFLKWDGFHPDLAPFLLSSFIDR